MGSVSIHKDQAVLAEAGLLGRKQPDVNLENMLDPETAKKAVW